MAKFTNFTACVVTVILCYLLANNMIDQDIVKKSALDWFWAPFAWFFVYALINLRQA